MSADPRADRGADEHGRDLLSALFTQQLGFARAHDIVEAGSEWLIAREKGDSLCDVLTRRGLLDEQRRRLVEALVDEALAMRGGDPKATLDSLPPTSGRRLPSVSTSLGGLGTTLRSPLVPDPDFTYDSLETPENVGVEDKGRYTFDTGPNGSVQELGRGGVGQVLVARDHFLQRDVAFKALHRDLTTSTSVATMQVYQLEARFLREARVTAQLDHPAVVPVYELGRRRDGTLYYTMQRVRGRTLAQALVDAGSLAGRLAFVPDLLTATQAVASAHHRQVIHRDLKPQNVMLGVHGETYVMDWGLARVVGRTDHHVRPVELAPDLTAGRDLGPVGTPSYMSPEQAWGRHDEVDERSDVWGLGAMLFELLTGRAPYIGRSPWDVLADVRSAPVPSVQELEPAAPPELVAICEKALCREREGRYANGAELAADLTAWVNGQRVAAYEYTSREVLRRLAGRHRSVLVLVLVMAATLIGVAAAGAVAIRRERDEARAMARFFLSDVSPALVNAPGATAVFDQLARSALEDFADGLDVERGPREDRLLLARTWNMLAALDWRLERRGDAEHALANARSLLEPLRRGLDDPQVLTEWIVLGLTESDLLVDDGRLEQARARLEVLSPVSIRLDLLAPDDPGALRAQALVASRLAGLDQLGQLDARPALRLAVARSERWATAAPKDSAATSTLVDNLVDLADELLIDDVPEAIKALRLAAAAARTARARSDNIANREALATAAAALGTVLVHRDDEEALATLREADLLLTSLVRADPGAAHLAARLVSTQVLLGKQADAQAHARELEANSVAGDAGDAVVLAAFAARDDDTVTDRAQSATATDTAVCYAALSQTLAGARVEAVALARRCLKSGALERQVWLSTSLAERARASTEPLATALVTLAEELPNARNTRADVTQALEHFIAALSEVR